MNSTLKLIYAALFTFVIALYVMFFMADMPNKEYLLLATLFGAYMAMNIGANDVANNVGPAVGSGALTMFWAIIIAAVFEFLGAILAGGNVVGTIKKGIISIDAFSGHPMLFVEAMSAALLAAALWLNLATWLKAPVSTTHSIVGGVMGAGIAAGGFGIVSWGTMGAISASWVISPLLEVSSQRSYSISSNQRYFIKMTRSQLQKWSYPGSLRAWSPFLRGICY